MEEEIIKEVAKNEIKPLSKIIRDAYRSFRYKDRIIRHENTYITLKDDKKYIVLFMLLG